VEASELIVRWQTEFAALSVTKPQDIGAVAISRAATAATNFARQENIGDNKYHCLCHDWL